MQGVNFLVSDQYLIKYVTKRIRISMFRPSLSHTPAKIKKQIPSGWMKDADSLLTVRQIAELRFRNSLPPTPPTYEMLACLAECAIKMRGIRRRFFLLLPRRKTTVTPSFSVIMEMIIIWKRSRRRCDEVAEWKQQVNSWKSTVEE